MATVLPSSVISSGTAVAPPPAATTTSPYEKSYSTALFFVAALMASATDAAAGAPAAASASSSFGRLRCLMFRKTCSLVFLQWKSSSLQGPEGSQGGQAEVNGAASRAAGRGSRPQQRRRETRGRARGPGEPVGGGGTTREPLTAGRRRGRW